MRSGTWLAEAVNTLHFTAEQRHRELLELLEAQSDDGKTQSDTKSLVFRFLTRRLSGSHNKSRSQTICLAEIQGEIALNRLLTDPHSKQLWLPVSITCFTQDISRA